MRYRVIAAAAALSVTYGSAALACQPAESGRVNGTNTVDNVLFDDMGSGTYTLGVRATGTGTNKLTVKVQEQKKVSGWKTLDTITIDLGNASNGCKFGKAQYVYDGDRDLRYRFSRKIGTQEIDYDWDHDHTVLWGGQSHRCLVCE